VVGENRQPAPGGERNEMSFCIIVLSAISAVIGLFGGLYAGWYLHKREIERKLDQEAISFAEIGDTYRTLDGDQFVLRKNGWHPIEDDNPPQGGEKK
jgi:hypothetical protein